MPLGACSNFIEDQWWSPPSPVQTPCETARHAWSKSLARKSCQAHHGERPARTATGSNAMPAQVPVATQQEQRHEARSVDAAKSEFPIGAVPQPADQEHHDHVDKERHAPCATRQGMYR